MWNELSRSEIDAAKQRLENQREEMLRRHAEELSAVESDQAEIQTLDRLIDAFVKKFKDGAPSASDAAATREPEPSADDSGEVQPIAVGRAQWVSR
jgi:uncharacterized protein involved in exopolysaccharide biosynthesis